MRNHKNLWLSRCGDNLTSWQHTKYVGWQVAHEPTIPIVTEPYSIYAYEHTNYRHNYGRSFMRYVDKHVNHTDLRYYVLDESYSEPGFSFDPTATVVPSTRFPQTFIYHLNGEINGKKYITVKNLIFDYLEPNAKTLPLVTVSAWASLSDYKAFNVADFDIYKNFLITDGEIINCAGYCRLQSNDYRINSYEYKVKQHFFDDIFNDPSVLHEGQLKYKGYDYSTQQFEIPEIREQVTAPADMVYSNNLPNRFSGYSTTIGAYNGSRILSIQFLTGGTNWKGGDLSPDGQLFPYNVRFGDRNGCLPTNTFYTLDSIDSNPYLPEAGKQNPYEVQTIVFQASAAGSPGRWFHVITRYWWNPEIGG